MVVALIIFQPMNMLVYIFYFLLRKKHGYIQFVDKNKTDIQSYPFMKLLLSATVANPP